MDFLGHLPVRIIKRRSIPSRLHAAGIISFAIINLRKYDGREVSSPGLVRDNPFDGPIGVLDSQLRLQGGGRRSIVITLPEPLKRRGIPARCEIRSDSVLPVRDRKSTRLNSSHTVISYAVFCLKKKKEEKSQH